MKVDKDDIKQVSELATARWGNWVKYVIGAVVGALVAGGVITLSGCGATVTVSGEQGMIQYDGSRVIIIPAVRQDGKK